jgi:hypothetical protein
VQGQTREEYVAKSLTPLLEPMVAEVLKGLDADPIAKMIEHLTAKKAAAASPSEDAAPAAEPAAPPA